MAEYFAPFELPFIPSNAVPLEGTFLLPICTTRERLLKILTALNVWRNLDHENNDYDPIADVLAAIPYIQDPLASPCMAVTGNDCVDYPTGYGRIIEWIPNNPHADVQPDYHPWYVLASNNDVTGQRAGDVLADLTTIGVDPLEPMPDPAPEFPRYRVTVSGTGTIELHMVSIPLGGMAQVQIDGDLLQVTYVDLNQDFASVPPELYSTVIWEHEFTAAGEHFIDVTLLPRMNDEATAFVGWGGGLRKIVLCGFDDAPRVPMFRFTAECGLEYRYAETEEWQPVAGWAEFAETCFEGPAGPAGEAGPAGPAGPAGEAGPAGYDDDGDVPVPSGVASEDKRCNVATAIADGVLGRYEDWLTAWIAVLADNANDYNAAYNELLTGAQGTLAGTAVASGVTANALPFFVGTVITDILGIGAVFAGITAYFAGKEVLDWIQIQTDIADPVFRQDLICLIAASLDTNGDLTAERWSDIRGGITSLTGASADARADFKDFLDRSVPVAIARVYALSPAVGDCDSCIESDHFYKWDFTESAGDWILSLGDGVAGTWIDGVGYKSTLRTSTGSIADELRMHRGFTSDFSRKIIRIEVDMKFTRGEVEFPAAQRGEISIKDPSASSTLFVRNATFDGKEVEDIDEFFRSNMQLIALASYENSVDPSPRGDVEFRGLKVWYNGANADFTGGEGY